jgi:translocation and assembly module TamB
VRFTGGPEIDPRLDVRLQAEENGVTGGVRVTGRASDPQIGFWSRQGLPEGEVMPRLLFGKPSQSLTPGQAVRLASGLAVLFQGSGGFVDRARGAVGLDVLAIDPTEEGADLTVGKNVSDDVFVGAKQSLDGQETSVTVEVEVFENVTVDSEVDPTGDASVGVNWRKDF